MEETGPSIKLANPMFRQKLDWGITLFKYEFPWQDFAKGSGLSAWECYEKYILVVRDPHTFFKKVINFSQPHFKEKYTSVPFASISFESLSKFSIVACSALCY